MVLMSLCYLSDPLVDPTWPFILFAYSVFELLCQIYSNSKTSYDETDTFDSIKTNVASFFGYDISDNKKKREAKRQAMIYDKYINRIKKEENIEYNNVVKFLNKTAKIE